MILLSRHLSSKSLPEKNSDNVLQKILFSNKVCCRHAWFPLTRTTDALTFRFRCLSILLHIRKKWSMCFNFFNQKRQKPSRSSLIFSVCSAVTQRNASICLVYRLRKFLLCTFTENQKSGGKEFMFFCFLRVENDNFQMKRWWSRPFLCLIFENIFVD